MTCRFGETRGQDIQGRQLNDLHGEAITTRVRAGELVITGLTMTFPVDAEEGPLYI